jgi:hypothetical protein
MHTLTADDLHYIVGMMPASLRNQIKAHKLMLAGGAIRSLILREKINDWDLFGASADILRDAADALGSTYAARTRTIKSKNAYTITAAGRTPIQLITRWTYSSAGELWKDFDFTIARAVIWCDADGAWRSAIDPDYYADLAARRLRYRSPTRLEDAGGSMMRVLKFLRAGYIIAPEQLAIVMTRITSRIKWDHDIVKEDGGLRLITALLREVDPMTIIDGVEAAEQPEPDDAGIDDALIPQPGAEESAP